MQRDMIDTRAQRWRALLAALLLGATGVASGAASGQGDPARGQYIAKAAGCLGCHTEAKKDAPPYAGGRALKTPFGTFYGPNITPDAKAGIGSWSEADFMRAMRRGERPDGASYFPAFPYPSFTQIADSDLRDLWAYLRSVPPSNRVSRPHELGLLYRWRALVTVWKWLFFTPGSFVADPRLSQVQNRGKYLMTALGHCGECHTPRNFLGASKTDRFFAGGKGPEGKRIPNLTPTRLRKWSDAELKDFLVTGSTPDGDVAAEAMAEIIRNTTSQLSAGDLDAMLAYLRSLPSLPEARREK
jgi:mono/diheme cytochrome c family protein